MPGIWESDAEWRRLKRELDECRARRVRADTLGQHRSPLEAAYTLVDRALASSAGVEGGPPPLPYVEPSLTPEVFPHGLVPGALRRDIDAPFLRHAIPATTDGEPLSNDLITCLPAVRELGSRAAAGDVTGVAAMQGVHLARELMDMEPLR
jgi:hypothetical protein